jgi:ELWxxDGT repeat protein
MKKIPYFVAGLCLIAAAATGQTSQLVRDINTQALAVPAVQASMVSVNPGSGEVLIIAVEDALNGAEIWKSDGTTAGTALVRDLVAGPDGSDPVHLTTSGSRVFFSAANAAGKRNLWLTNGLSAGTSLVEDLGFPNSNGPERLTNLNGTLFFVGFDQTDNYELWKSDGTANGTVQVKNINPNLSGASGINHPFPLGSMLYFTATDGASGRELYKSDGTLAGTVRVVDLVAGGGTPFVEGFDPSFAAMNGVLYFAADTGGDVGAELWRSDGTGGGTVLVADIFPGSESSDPQFLTPMTVTGGEAGSYLYFSATNATASGAELWRSDGQAGGNTILLKEIRTGGDSSNPRQFTVVGSMLFFTADDGSGEELHVSNGRTGAANTARVADIVAGANGSQPSNLTVFNATTLVFTAVNAGDNLGLYTCTHNGTALPTTVTRLKDLGVGSSVSHLTRIGSKVFFLLNGSQLWETDLTNSPAGNANGTKLVYDFRATTASSDAASFAVSGGQVFFAADDGVNGRELWKSDGTDGGTELVADLFPGTDGSFLDLPNSSEPQHLTVSGGRVFFSATDGASNRELWVHDPLADPQTYQVRDINDGDSSDPQELTDFNGVLFFTATDGSGIGKTGRELWRSNGTMAGTVQIADLVSGGADSNPRKLTVYKNQLYFFANSGIGRELVKTNGTPGNVDPVRDIAQGGASGIIEEYEDIAIMGAGASQRLYFSARNDGPGGGGQELWTSDGTEAGTVRVRDINPGAPGSNPKEITTVGNLIFFAATDGVTGTELWRSNGTEAGTLLVRDIATGAPSASPRDLTASAGRLFFTADDGVNGRELWVSTGNSTGTVMLTDFRNGTDRSASLGIRDLRDIDGVLCFTADDGVNGRELWISDGTPAGTRMINDLSGPLAASNPEHFTSFNGQLLYTAADAVSGNEPRLAFIGAAIQVEQPEGVALANNGAPVNFGTLAAGVSTTLNIVVRNAGINTLRDIKPVISGINAAEFALVAPKAATTLTQGQSTTFGVRFTPREGGPREAQVSILSSDALNNPFIVNLYGEGIKDPTVTEQPDSLMLLVGQAAAFDAEASSDSVTLTEADYQWRRNNGAIKGALGTSYGIPAVTLKDAGAYSVLVRVGKTVALSNPAQLGVVQANMPATILAAGAGRAVNLTVTAAGNGLTYQWFKGATPLADTTDGRIKGSRTPKLLIGGLTTADSDLYSCQVTGAGGTQTGGQTQLKVFTEKPVLNDPQNLPDGIVGGSYNFPVAGFLIAVDPAPEKAPLTYTAKGLPTGLKLNPKTGVIAGRPTKAGAFDVTLTARNTATSDPVTETIVIDTFPANLSGSYAALVDRDAGLNDRLGGRLDITVSGTGALSGTLTFGSERLGIKGGLEVDATGTLDPTFTVTLKRKNKPDAVLTFDIDIDNRVLTGDVNGVPVNGWRHVYAVEAAPYMGYHTFGLRLGDPGQVSDDDLPQGWGYATFTVAKDGKWKMAGRTADGETITGAAAVGFGRQIIVYQALYKPFAGSLWGFLSLDPVDTDEPFDNSLSGDVDWVRPAATNTKTRAYQAGFGLPGTPEASPIPLEAVGGSYRAPGKDELILELGAAGQDNVELLFSEGGLDDADQNPDQVLGILAGNKPFNPKPAGPTLSTLKKLTAKTGLIEGSFRLTDPDPRTGATGNVVRDAIFRGVLIRDDVEGASYGAGHFLLEALPEDGQTPKKTTPVFSGAVELRENDN